MVEKNFHIYQQYLKRFEEKFGSVEIGQPVMSGGKLVEKLTPDNFNRKWIEHKKTEEFLRNSMSNGHTLSDDVERQYEEICAAILQKPKDFKLL